MNIQRRQAFTLIEALISVAIFAIVATLAVVIFMNFQKLPLKQLFGREVQEEATYLMEELNYHLKREGINYDAYGPGKLCGELQPGVPTRELCIGNGEVTKFALGKHPITGEDETLYAYFNQYSDATGQQEELNGFAFPLTTESVRVTDIRFVITPTTDPFKEGSTEIEHPTLHIYIELENLTGEETFSYQTLLTVRRYE